MASLPSSCLVASQYGGMFFTDETYAEFQAWIQGLPAYEAPGNYVPAADSVDLLSHLHYTPNLRDQAPTGTCWAWENTAAMSIDFDTQFGGDPVIKEGFSVPFLASNAWMVGSDLNKGGHVGLVKAYYDMIGYAVPSRNTFAMWNAVWDSQANQWETDETFGIRPAAWLR